VALPLFNAFTIVFPDATPLVLAVSSRAEARAFHLNNTLCSSSVLTLLMFCYVPGGCRFRGLLVMEPPPFPDGSWWPVGGRSTAPASAAQPPSRAR
jgi:hypothetical protein